MVEHDHIDDILFSVFAMVRQLKASAGDLCARFSIPSGDGDESVLSVTQVRPIIFLYLHGRSSVGAVAADSGVSLATASQMLDKLVDAGWVERGPNPDDRRQVHVWLTEPAIEVAQQIHAIRREQVKTALDLLDTGDRESVPRVFRAFSASLDRIPASGERAS